MSSWQNTLDEDIALWADLGIDRVGLISLKLYEPGWDVGQKTVLDAGLSVESMVGYPHENAQSLEFAGGVGAKVMYVISGRASSVPWEEAAEKFCESMATLLPRARELGVRLAVEPTNPLRCDESFLFTVRDAFDLARMAGIGVCLDLYSAWYERGLQQLVRKNIDLLALVQICDYKIGTLRTGDRCAVGDGDIPVEQLMAMVLDAGYEGPFELEILGPAVEAEGRAPIERSIERTSEMLYRLGA
jgi:sugar phosphate isomerase/epimerase